MAKSTRSKVKRAFRAKKREDGVYAAVEAARLHRLHQKLKMVAAADAEGDVALTDVDAQREDAEDAAGGFGCSFWLGLVDQMDITPEVMGGLARAGALEALCR